MNADLSEALTRARRLLADGALPESLREYEGILALDPQHVEALNAVGMWSVRGGNIKRGLSLLERAAGIASEDPLTIHNLAQVYQAMDAPAQALETYRRVLRIKPDLYIARLAVARLLEESGRVDDALPLYFRAISDAQRDGRWMSAQSTARNLQPLVEHAFRTVQEGRGRLYGGLLDGWQRRFGRDEMKRVEHCLRTYLGEQASNFADDRQRPTFLYFPGLPANPYLDRKLVPELDELEGQWRAIRDELFVRLGAAQGSEAVFHSSALEDANLRGLHGRPQWNGYYFERHGEQRDDNRAACPVTAAALDRLPICRIRGHAPETLFSVLSPGTHLLPHRGITNTRVVGHLALIIPDDCALRVADEEYRWREGSAVLFDDTYLHEAWNRSEHVRVVLIFDLWNPYLSEAERTAVAELVAAIGDFREAAERF